MLLPNATATANTETNTFLVDLGRQIFRCSSGSGHIGDAAAAFRLEIAFLKATTCTLAAEAAANAQAEATSDVLRFCETGGADPALLSMRALGSADAEAPRDGKVGGERTTREGEGIAVGMVVTTAATAKWLVALIAIAQPS